MSPGKRTRRLEPRRYRPSANYGQLERYNRTLMQAVRCYVERPRTNGTSTSGRSRVRYAPCPVNSSTGYTQPVDAGKGDLLYPVPDPTPRPGGGGGGALTHNVTQVCAAVTTPIFSLLKSLS